MSKETVSIQVDDEFHIVVDRYNWMVIHTRVTEKGKNKGEIGEFEEAYCRDLPSCLQSIMRIKSEMNVDISSITDYLSWYDSTIHSMTDRILREKERLLEALELNKIIAA